MTGNEDGKSKIAPPPPSLADLPAGTQLVAGMGVATILPDFDFETYSEAGFVWGGEKWACLPRASQGKKGLPVVGAAAYAEHPTCEPISLAYDLKDGRGPRHWKPGDPQPQELFDYLVAGGLIEAWNVGFERHIWEKVCVPRFGWPLIARRQYRCAMAKARAHALPGALGIAGEVVGAATQKDKDGTRLLNKFSIPRNPTLKDKRLRIRPSEDLIDGPLLYRYNTRDIAAEAEVSSVTPDLHPDEQEWWFYDQEINCRGVQIDTKAIEDCVVVVEAALERYNLQLFSLTNGAVESASQVERLTGWLAAQGVQMVSLDEEHLGEALKRTDLPDSARTALELRAKIGSASIKKLFAMRNQVCADGRLRDLYLFHAARTGRATSQGAQAANLPNHGPEIYRCAQCGKTYGREQMPCPWCGSLRPPITEEWGARPQDRRKIVEERNPLLDRREGTMDRRRLAVEDALDVMAGRSLDLAEYYYEEALPAISGCLRGLFISAPGHDLICSDYSAIEAVVLAELAGEKWRQEVFRTHGKIYEASASKVTRIPLSEILDHKKNTGSHHPARKKGKVLELALGYGGFIGALIAFGAAEFMTEEEMREAALAWRAESPAIVEFWGGQRKNWQPCLFGMEGAALQAVQNPGVEFETHGFRFVVRQDVLYLRLLSGRYLTYHHPRLRPSDRRRGELTLSYEGWNSNPKYGKMGWSRMDTYGPKFVENCVQATARDIQRDAIIAQEKAGYSIVLHVYDENIAEVPEGWGSIEEFERLMLPTAPWCAHWPVKAAGGWRGKRYRKD